MAYSLWSVCDPPEEMIDRRPSNCAPGLWRLAGIRTATIHTMPFLEGNRSPRNQETSQFLIRFVVGFLRDDGRGSRTGSEGQR
jgi:hypothetical protein